MPTTESITDEYVIISPLLNTTFGSLNESNVSAEGKAIFFVQLLEAVAFLHENGFCHRDIKPENILVRSYEPPEAMLTDFGCASDKETIMYDWPGTVPYLAPEQAEGKTHGRAVDYWSCGLVGVELSLGGRIKSRLMPGPNLMAVHEHLRKENTPLAKCSRAMLEEDPKTRMTAAQSLNFFSSLKETGLSLSSPTMAYQLSFAGETNQRLLQNQKPKSRLASDFATHREIQEPYNAPSASTRSKARKWANLPSLNAEINSSERPNKQLKKGNWLGKMAPNG
jgi:serine/threonine protein kinase